MTFTSSQRGRILLFWKVLTGYDLSPLSLLFWHRPPKQRAALTTIHRRPSSPSSCFRSRLPTHFCGATNLGCGSPIPDRCHRWSGGRAKVRARNAAAAASNVRCSAPQITPLHPGLLSASLLRSRRLNSGQGRQGLVVPLHLLLFGYFMIKQLRFGGRWSVSTPLSSLLVKTHLEASEHGWNSFQPISPRPVPVPQHYLGWPLSMRSTGKHKLC